MTIEFDHGIEKVPALQHEYFELSNDGMYVPGGRAGAADTPYWIICDFEDDDNAAVAAAAIRKPAN